ncbi:MAG: ABC transporter ATP-binding protein [Desulfovibrionaceae bacterium]|nr:ABC transporter ATP-binding protein [Desulfovibrionaceae bacterium]
MSKRPSGVVALFADIWRRLPPRRAAGFWVLLAGLCAVALLETAALGLIALFASSVASPRTVLDSSIFSHIKALFPIVSGLSATDLILVLACSVVLAALAKNGLQSAVVYWCGRFTSGVSGFFGEKLLGKFLAMPYEWHLNRNSADLVQAASWSRAYVGFFLNHSLTALSDLLIISFMLAALLIVTPMISLAVILALGLSSVVIFRSLRRALDAAASDSMRWQIAVNRQATLALHGVKELMIFGRAQEFLRDYHHGVFAIPRLYARQQMFARLPAWALECLGFGLLAATIWVMLVPGQSSSARMSGTLALLAVTAWRALPAVSRILSSLTQIRTSLPYASDSLAYFDQAPAPDAAPDEPRAEKAPAWRFKDQVRLEGVGFSYCQALDAALEDLTLSIQAGSTVGLIGRSGAGKSTLVDTIIGLLPPGRGRILVDGRELDAGLRPAWMAQLGYVPQSPYIFDGSLAENVALAVGDAGIDRQRVKECCDLAYISDFLDQLPNGLDTAIGERGVRLSGGQRQRVSIARALYHRPEVLIFDEATSSLDQDSEREILKTVYGFKGRLTLVIVAHRLSTVQGCDQVVWLDKGRVRMIGPPDTVLPLYSEDLGGRAEANREAARGQL